MKRDEYNGFLRKVKCSDEFRSRMQEKLSSPTIEVHEYADSVSGTEVITAKHSWGRFAAAAAAFVLVCGAVCGGAYQLARMNNKTEEGTNISETEEDASIYSKLKANRDKYKMDNILCLFDEEVCAALSLEGKEQKAFFEYMDQFDMNNRIEEGDLTKTPKSLRFVFRKNEKNLFIFDIYQNGDCTWKEKVKGKEITTYHSFSNGETVYNDLSERYNIEASLGNAEFFVDYEEIKDFIDESYKDSFDPTSSLMNTAVRHEGSQKEIYEIKNKIKINNIILSCNWLRADEFDYTDYYSINGISINKDGYMAGYYNGIYVVYKPRKSEYLDKLRQIWDECLIPMDNALIDIDTAPLTGNDSE